MPPGEIAGFAAGSAAGALTANPFVGVATGLAVRFATSEAEAYLDRRRQAAMHAAITTAAGAADEGEVVPWSVELGGPDCVPRGALQRQGWRRGGCLLRRRYLPPRSAWRWAASEPTAQRW